MKRKAVPPSSSDSEERASSGSSSLSSPPLLSWSPSSSSFSSPPPPSWLSSDTDTHSSLRSVSCALHNVEQDQLSEEVSMRVSPQKCGPAIIVLSSSESEKEDSESSNHSRFEDSESTEEGDKKVEIEVEEEKSFTRFGSSNHHGADSDDDDDDEDEDEEGSVSSGSVMDSQSSENSAKYTPAKHNEIVVDDADEEEKEEEEELEEDVDEEAATEIRQVLLNSVMEDDIDEDAGKHSLGSQESSDNDSEEETKIKDSQGEEIDECYKWMDFCLANSNDFGAETGLADEETAKNKEQLCEEGKHHLVLDEQIGTYCNRGVCSYVKEEIRYVLAPFHDNPFADFGKDDYCTHGKRDPSILPQFEDSEVEYQHFKDGTEFDTSGTVWEIKPGLRDTLLAHQREAFEFIWKNVAGGTNLAELMKKRSSEGGGCLISHAPGTGKTRLTISFLETYMKFRKKSRPVVLVPASILLTWKQEFEKWKVDVPFLNMNEDELSDIEISFARSLFGLKNLIKKDKRLIKLLYWEKHESVLAISYSLFTKIAEQDEKIRDFLTERLGILILDEAHVARNERSLIFKALEKVKTKKRILLSGIPFQNNFRELCNTLCLMRKEFNHETEPFKKSGVDESDEGKIRDLKEKMKPFCHRCSSNVLSTILSGLLEYNVTMQPSKYQKRLLDKEEKQPKSLERDVNMALISIHPMLLHCKESKTDFAQELISGKWDISDGAKIRFLVTFIQLSSSLQEKVLVFSQYLQPLNFVKAILQSGQFGWRKGVEIHVMNGSQTMKKRKRIMDEFNKPNGKAKVMLASTKACSEGIKLTGASRVIFLDVSWNPAVEEQAVGRAYRMGQESVVRVYRLILSFNDNNRHLTQTQKNGFYNYMFSWSNKKSDDGHQSSMPGYEDVILERLREENIIQEAIHVKQKTVTR